LYSILQQWGPYDELNTLIEDENKEIKLENQKIRDAIRYHENKAEQESESDIHSRGFTSMFRGSK